MLRGVCLDALNASGCPSPRRLRNLGVNGARLVAQDEPPFYAYANELIEGGFDVAVVLARESFAADDYQGEAGFYASHVPASLWILGNEQDAGLLDADSLSSWKMEPVEYGDFFRRAALGILNVQPTASLCLGGFVAGQPSALADYLAAIRQTYGGPISGYDVHPYSKTASETNELLYQYQRNAEQGMQPYVMEWNRPPREIPSYVRMLEAVTFGWAWFCFSDGQVPPFGLFTPSGGQRRSYGALKKALKETA